ncbi:MAG: HlyD family secretion protein [Pseudomonadota bacterium]
MTLIAIAVAAAVFVYYVIADRTTPFSSDARVQAFVVRIAPEVAGQVRSVAVSDNAIVEQGELLFSIDPTPFEIAVDQAQARLDLVGQTIGASTAAVDAAQAKLDEARAADANVRAQSARVLDLVKRGVYAEARSDQAIAAIDEAQAAVDSAEADLRRAEEELGPEGQDNPQVQDAIATLERARFDLSRTTVSAPSRGVVTNLQLAGGQTVSPGQAAMTFISVEDVWLLASIRENSLGVLASGQRAEVVLDSLPGQIYPATLRSIGWGIAGGSVDPATGLPKSTSQTGWLTDPERFPVQLVFDAERPPRGARYGSRAAVIIYASRNPVMDAIAWARMRLIALLTYVS